MTTEHQGVVEAEVVSVEWEDAEPVAVDQIPDPKPTAYTRITAAREGSKQPILADWLRDAGDRAAIARWTAGYAGHVCSCSTWSASRSTVLHADAAAGLRARSDVRAASVGNQRVR